MWQTYFSTVFQWIEFPGDLGGEDNLFEILDPESWKDSASWSTDGDR